MPSSHPLPPPCHWFSRLASALDPRSAPRLGWLFVGAVLARGRRAVTRWVRAAGLTDEYRRCYVRARRITFRDLKQVVGAGQQQVRFVRASVGVFHFCLWAFTLTEARAWGRDGKGLVEHRSSSPWDDGARRPSHADKRRAWQRELLGAEIRAVLRPGQTEEEIAAAAERLLDLAA